MDQGLIGHWPLTGDGKDHGPVGHASTIRNVRFESDGAHFNGRDAMIRVTDHASLKLGASDFTISAHIHTEQHLGGVIGDIVGKFDPVARRGFNFAVVDHQGTATCQGNYRNVHFGIDNAQQKYEMLDCGRPGNAKMIYALTVFDGSLYATTFEWGADERGHLWRYEGGDKWHDCGSPSDANAVTSAAVHDGALYVGSGRYKCVGSHIVPSPNETLGGHVYRYDGDGNFVDCGQLGDGDCVIALTTHNGKLYATSHYHRGAYVYEGGTTWRYIGPDLRLMAMTSWHGHLYTTTNGDEIYRYDDDGTWTSCGKFANTTQTYGMAAYEGELFVTTWPDALVYHYNGQRIACTATRPGHEKETMGLCVYNGMLYTGSLPLANVYRYDPHCPMEYEGQAKAWTPIDTVDNSRRASVKRAWSFAVYDGKMFVGTLPSGHVKSFEAGRVATVDRALDAGWHHLAAVRRGDKLQVFIDGKPAAESTTFNAADFDLSNDAPLHIGFGSHDYFNGIMRDVRLYDRALDDAQIGSFMK
jgi:hypothetical protein